MSLRVLSVCSGLGGLDLGLHRAGFSTVGFVEQEPFCRALLTRHWPDVPHVHTDLITLSQDAAALAALPDFDVLAGGIPCQPSSSAGKRKGTSDARWLWPHFARILEVRRPAAALVENVRGLLSAQKGWAFASILRGAADLNYAVEWELLAAGTLGAPHKRERVFLIFTEVGTPALGGKVALGCAWPRAVGQRGGEGRREREGAVGLDGRRPQKEGARQGKKKPRDPWTFKWPVAGRFAPDPTRGGEWTVFARTPLWPTPSPLPWEVAADAEALEQAVELKSGVLPREFHDESELTPGAARMLAEGRLRSSLPTPLSSDGYKEATGTLPRLVHTGHRRGRLDGLTREGRPILRQALPTPAASCPNDHEDPDEWEARRKILAAKWGTNGAGTPLAVAAKRRAALPTPTSTDAQDRDYQVALGTAYPTLGHAAKTAAGVESQMVRRALPTPRAEDGESADVSHARRAAGVVDSLTGVVRRALPTPQAADGERASENGLRGEGNPTLLGEARRRALPTPQAHDAQGQPGAGTLDRGGREADLCTAVRRALPTPTATTGGEVGSDAAREGGPDLRAEAHRRALPTPAARDFRDPGRDRSDSPHAQPLSQAIVDRGVATTAGRLSPALPEWMLGFEIGWSRPHGPSMLNGRPLSYLPRREEWLTYATNRPDITGSAVEQVLPGLCPDASVYNLPAQSQESNWAAHILSGVRTQEEGTEATDTDRSIGPLLVEGAGPSDAGLLELAGLDQPAVGLRILRGAVGLADSSTPLDSNADGDAHVRLKRAGVSQVRQPGLCQARSSVCGDDAGQHPRCSPETAPRLRGEERAGQIDRSGGIGDPSSDHARRETVRVGGDVQRIQESDFSNQVAPSVGTYLSAVDPEGWIAAIALTTEKEHRRPRLRALGNSVCVPVAVVIGEGLARAAGAVLRSREAARHRQDAVVVVQQLARGVDGPLLRPWMKWSGGKRQLLPQIVAAAARQAPPGGFTAYVEPFVGGGASWMALRAAGLLAPGCRVILGDACAELMGAWVCIRDDVEGLITAVGVLRAAYNGAGSDEERERLFLAARERIRALERGEGLASEEASHLDRFSSPAAAADLLLINRCGFNGLWRVNASGLCNVPWGKRARFDGLDFDNLRAVSAALAEVELVCGDFAETLRRAAA